MCIHGGVRDYLSCVSSCKKANSMHGPLPSWTNYLQRPHFQTPSHWGVRALIYEFVGDKNIQSIAEDDSLAKQQNKPTNRFPSLSHSLAIQYQAVPNFPYFPIFKCMCVFAADKIQRSYYQKHSSSKKRVSQGFKAQGLEEMPILFLVKFLLTLNKQTNKRFRCWVSKKNKRAIKLGLITNLKVGLQLGPSDYFRYIFEMLSLKRVGKL